MQFTDIFIRRPVFATVLSLILLITGLVASRQLPIRQFPKTDASVISISTTYTGASAALVESFISQPIEDAISGVDNVDYITSTSEAGKSKVNIYLKLNADINEAMLDAQSKLTSVVKKLPDDVDNPVIQKQDPDASPIIIIAFADKQKTSSAITDYLTRAIVPELSNLTGVSEATIFGKRTYAIRVWLDPKLMAAHNIAADDVRQALEDNNIQAQAGEIDRQHQVLSVNASTSINSPAQFDRLIIKRNNNQFIRLQDIGHATLGAADYTSSLYVNGHSGVGVGIIAKSNANPLDISSAVNAKLKQIQQELPAGMTASIARDSSLYIQQSIDEVQHTIIEACLLVVLVIFLFIGSLRSVFIPVVTIPLSLFGACALMLALGYSLNLLTLLAFVLAIGMVVDDAIVVLENIHRHVEAGMAPLQAAIVGAQEIRFAVIAMTLTLAAVYAPIGFSSGLTGALFREFAFTLAGTVIISGFIALTLSPMMCSKIMRPSAKLGWFGHKVDVVLSGMTQSYRRLLANVLTQRLLVVVITVTIFICGIGFFIPLLKQSTLAPREDQGDVMAMLTGPTASNLAYTETYSKQLEKIFDTLPEKSRYAIINGRPNGQNSAMSFLSLVDWSQRQRSADQIIHALNSQVEQIAGMRVMLINRSSLPGASSYYPVQLNIKTSGSYQELSHVVDQFIQQAEQNPGIVRMQSQLKLDKPEIQVDINRDKANDLGISMSNIADALNIGLGQPAITTYVRDGLTYDVILQFIAQEMNDPSQINNINVKTISGKLMPLSNLVKISNVIEPTSLDHFQGQRAATINVILNSGYTVGEAVAYFQQLASQVLPGNMQLDFSGEARQFLEEGSSMLQIFCFALVFIYLVLSAQFESFRDPFIVLLTVPVAISGALATLFFTHSTLNIFTEIGLITLIGLISKHGILIVEFANQQLEQGASRLDAAINAASVRLRPILMTTAAMVLGALPLAMASGAGAVSRQQIGYVIVGGMTFGTLFTLFVVPTFYTLLASKPKPA